MLEVAFYDCWYSEILPLIPLTDSLVFHNHYIETLSKAFYFSVQWKVNISILYLYYIKIKFKSLKTDPSRFITIIAPVCIIPWESVELLQPWSGPLWGRLGSVYSAFSGARRRQCPWGGGQSLTCYPRLLPPTESTIPHDRIKLLLEHNISCCSDMFIV